MHQEIPILPQPNEVTCGPTCLHAVYSYYGHNVDLMDLIGEVSQLEGGGTLAVLLGIHALENGYNVTLYTYNLHIFDPSWFSKGKIDLAEKLKEQALYKNEEKLRFATDAYLQFLKAGGEIKFEELRTTLIRKYLNKGIPVITGLSATYLYGVAREIPETNQYDDIKGEPAGHFVVISAYDKETRMATVADPYQPNPISKFHPYYDVTIQRLINSILLGIVTYDANLLIIQPKRKWPK